MRRSLPSRQMRAKSAPQRQAIITRNPSIFRLGATIPSARLRGWFNVPSLDLEGLSQAETVRHVRNHDLCMVAAYTQMNKVLSRRGLVIRRLQDRYVIQTLAKAIERVGRLSVEATMKSRTSARLDNGITRHQGIFSALTADELARSE